jgi:antitoxin component YwqK of YwqJK toxin-antitoxin module
MFERFRNKKNMKAPRNGNWKEFNKQAVLVSEGHYQHDLKHGLWKQFYETGELLIEETYDNGILHGRYASYHLNGRLLSAGQYQHGRREGYFNIFDENGKQVKRLLFVNNIQMEDVDSSRVPAIQRERVVSH